MHNQKRVFASVIALMLCVVTLFTGALAYTVQQATQGYPQPPTYKGGTNSTNAQTSFTDPSLVGYRFSCYRTTDPEVVAAKGGTPEEIANAYSMHNAPGKQLGHSINIMLNATDSSGGSRTDYANDYNQTGLKMPHMLTNGEGTDFYNKISLAQTEMATDKTLGDKKLTHSAATGLALFDYSGNYNGILDNVNESSSFNFYEPLLQHIDDDTEGNPVLNSKLANAKDRTPVTIYSGYYAYDRWVDFNLNPSPDRAEEAKNLYTYIYGFQYSQPMSTTSHAGKDMSPKYLTISDIDYEGSDVAPFNHNPSNIINSGNPNSWVNKNHTLIATLCGLKVRYNEYGPDLTTEEFGVYDYIIVEPIYMYYYHNTRYYTTVSDTSILQADSQRDVKGDATDNCWSKVYYNGHELSAICGVFPASYGTALYTETPYFGVDGVYNATTERNYSKNVWTYSPYSLNHDAIKSDAKYTYTNEKGQKVTAKVNPNTHAYVFTKSNGYTMFTGGTKNGANQRVWFPEFDEMFIAPQFPIESLLGAGIFMSGPDKTPEIKYEVVYHANPNSGSMNNADVKTQVINESANRLALYSYDVGISAKDVPLGKIASNYWTFNAGNNGQGIADNAINAITNIYPNGTYQNNGKIPASYVLSGKDNIKAFFETYGVREGFKITVHLYAAWNTKSLITTVNRTYSNKQIIQEAILAGGHFMGDEAKEDRWMPKGMAMVSTDGNTIIPLTNSSNVKYQWLPQGEYNTNADYYIVYSFSKDSFTPEEVKNVIKGISVAGVQCYRNSAGLVKWTSDINLFYFDFYTYEVEAPNTTITYTVNNYPDSDNVFKGSAENSILLYLPRRCNFEYTSKVNENIYFDVNDNFGYVNDWTNQGECAWLGKEAKKRAAEVNYIKVDNEGFVLERDAVEILTKHVDSFVTKSAKTLKIIPRLDGNTQLPFTQYFVNVYDINAKKYYQYAYKANGADIGNDIGVMSTSETGVVTQMLLNDSHTYKIYVSASSVSGRAPMLEWIEINSGSISNETTYEVYVDYYTTDVTIQTQSGGNHSPIGATIALSNGDAVFATVNTERIPTQESGKDAFCSEKHNSKISVVTLGGEKVSVAIERGSNENWYLSDAKINGESSDILNDKKLADDIESDGRKSNNSNGSESVNTYIQSRLCEDKYVLKYVFAPYHYITFNLDNEIVNYDTLISKPDNYEVYQQTVGINQDNTYTFVNVLRGKYNQSFNVPDIIDYDDISDNILFKPVKYDEDAVVNTILEFYTVETTADNGYKSTQIEQVENNKAYVLSSYNNISTYNACSTGYERADSFFVENNTEYQATATLKSGSNYKNTTAIGGLTLFWDNNTEIITSQLKTINPGTSVSFKNVAEPSKIHWNSEVETYDVKFVFYINDVPYESLPETIADNISLDGSNKLTFGVDGIFNDKTQNVVATGEASQGIHYLYLAGMNTGVSYEVKVSEENVYYVYFYTLRVAAGRGIQSVSIEPTNNKSGWNGTLPYISFTGKRSATTLAVWPQSNPGYIYIDAAPLSEQIEIDGELCNKYSFDRWDTKRPTKDISITYANNKSDTSSDKATYVVTNKMNHATVVQAEAIPNKPSPIDIPDVVEPNSVYYGVCVRSFTDGHITNPWESIYSEIKLSESETYKDTLINGQLSWAVVLDEVVLDKATHKVTLVDNPYKGKSVKAILPPSECFQNDSNITTDYFYSANNAYIENQYVYIDGFYYTQTIQTQVNGINKPPFPSKTSDYKDVVYNVFYKSDTINTTNKINVNDAGAFQVVLMKDVKLNIGGRIYAHSNAPIREVVSKAVVTGRHAYIIPYYTVVMENICENIGTKLDCATLRFFFNDTGSVNMKVAANIPYVVMEGDYKIKTEHLDTYHNTKKHGESHKFIGWGVGVNEVFTLEYVDSGDGKFPYPVLTYTGESRMSNSRVSDSSLNITKVHVSDETKLIARYTCSTETPVNLTLHAQCYDENNQLITNVNPVTMFVNINGSKQFVDNGETKQFGKNTNIDVSAALDEMIQTYSVEATVNIKLTGACGHKFNYDSSVRKCPTCGKVLSLAGTSIDDSAVVYYSIHENAAKVDALIQSADVHANNPEIYKDYLAKNGVVVMEKIAVGQYKGLIPYSESKYNLYMMQSGVLMKQPGYQVENTKLTKFVWGAPANGHDCSVSNTSCAHKASNNGDAFIWCGTAGLSNGKACACGESTCQGTPYSDFSVTMNKDRVYTAVVHRVTENASQSDEINQTIDYVCCSIYTNTDYEEILPYDNTFVNLNNNKVKLESATGHHFIVPKDSTLTLSAQQANNGGYKNIFNGVVSSRKTFLLSYNTVTVKGDVSLNVGINGTDSQSETWLANYAIDSGALQSAGTKYSVFAEGGQVSNTTLYKLDSNVTVKTISGFIMDLIPVPELLNNNEEAFGGFVGQSAVYYLYMLPNTEINRDILDQHVIANDPTDNKSYVIGISTKSTIEGQLAKKVSYITFVDGIEYDIILDWQTKNLRIVASAVGDNKFTVSSKSTDYTFNNIPNGSYEIHLGGNLFVTTESDIVSTSGTVTKDGYYIKVVTTKNSTISNGSDFDMWHIANIPGTAKTTYVEKGEPVSTTDTNKNIKEQLLVGTIQYVATIDTISSPSNGSDSGIVSLSNKAKVYQVKTYVNDVLMNPTGISYPVKFNSSLIDIVDGESKPLPSISFPTVEAKNNIHDGSYCELYNTSAAILFDANTNTFSIYYYTVTFDVNDASLGEVITGPNCDTELPKGEIVVAKGSVVTSADIRLDVSDHIRIANAKDTPGYTVNFTEWTLNESDAIPETITEKSHFIAHFNSDIPEYKVTLYNKSKYFNNLRYWNSNTNSMTTGNTFAITQTRLKEYSALSKEYPHTNIAPGTVQGVYKYGAQGHLYATVSDPCCIASNNGTASITLNLKGGSTSQEHVVELVNIDTNAKYTYKVNAGKTQARFTSIPSGKYQLYVDGIKYKTSFSYDTHDVGCKVYDNAFNTVKTPSYTTNESNGGILYVAPVLTVRNFYVSHWSQIRNDRVLGDIEYMNGVCDDVTCSGYDKHQGCTTQTWKNLDKNLDPRNIRYYYVCNVCGKGENNDLVAGESSGWTNIKLTNCTECGSSNIRMKFSRLITPDIVEDLDYYVYSGYNDVNHNPINIVQDVDMNYPVYVQTVLDGVEKLPFSNGKVKIEYTTDNKTWTSETKNFDNNGKTVFYIPVGASYRIIGASSDEWKTENYTSGGFSVNKSSYTNIGLPMNGDYVGGDGDDDNDGMIDNPGTTYYIHYYTVTIKAGEGIKTVIIFDGSHANGKDNATVVSAIYQRGVTASGAEERADGTSPVSVRLLKDGKVYGERTVYLSTSHSSNDKKYKLEWNPITQRYEHDAVEGKSTSAGSIYYLWANGKCVNGQYTDEYTGVVVTVKPWKEPIKWTGNCKHDTHAQIYDRTELCTSDCNVSEFEHFSPLTYPSSHEFVVYHTTTEIVAATPNAPTYRYKYASDHPGEPEDTAYYYNLITSGDAGIAATTGSGVYLERTKPNIGAALVTNHLDKGKTQITVTLHLDDKLWGGQIVTIGGQPTKEISTGVYKTDYYFGSGVYDINVSSPNSTLLSYSKYGQIEVSSVRTYTWKTWTDGHVVCSKCGAIGNCCETNKCNDTLGVYCTNCHIHTDNAGNVYSCCTTGAHDYSNCIYSPSCLANTTNAALQSTTVTMLHDTKMHAVTTYTDEFNFTGDTVVEFYSVRVDADAGIDKVVINAIRYNPTTTITNHGAHATYGTIFTNGLPNRIYTNTKNVTSFCTQIVVLKGKEVGLGTNVIKKPAVNHAEATTALSIAVTLNGNPYLGRNVTIGGFAATDNDNDGIYVTDYQGFVGGKKYIVTVDGRYAGTIDLTSSREYQWLQWSNPWNEAGVCKIHNTVCGTGSYISSVRNPNNKTSTIRGIKSFLHIVARTKFIDNFTVEFVDHTNTPKDPVVDLYTLDISETLNDKTIDAFPIKITTTAHGQIYLIPDGDNYYVFDSDGKQLSKIDYIHSITDGRAQLVLMNGDEWAVEAIKEIEDKNADGVINHKDIIQSSSYQYAYTAHSSGKIDKASATTIVKFYTLTLDVYSDGEHKLPSFGTVNNDSSDVFENPVWIDDVVAENDGIADTYGDTDLKPVLGASTIKAYLAGSTYEVGAKTADDNDTNANMKPGTGYLKQHSAGVIDSEKVVTVEYFSLNTDHYGGFTDVQISYQGNPYVTATTPSGANSNAIAKAFFLKGENASINATVATNNTWLNWTGTSTLKTQLAEISMDSKKVYSAWAQTYATVRFFLHDKNENWYQTSAGYITQLITINNRDWNTVTITGEPLKYVGFDAFRTHLYSDPNAAVDDMRDKVISGIANTVIDVVINEKQEGGQSFVDFYYTRKGSLVDPTPDTPVVPPVVPTPYEPKPTPPSPTDWDVDSKKEYVKITYVLNGGTYNGKPNNVTSIHFVGTDITLIKPTPPAGQEFVGWFLTDYKGNPSSANGLIGTSFDHYLLCEDTVVYAVYINKTDIGITANDIYGTIKSNSEFMTSATIINHHNLSVIPTTKIDAVLSVYVNGIKDNSLTKRVENIICPGNGTQLVYTTVNTSGWNPNAKYKLEWSLDFSDPECMYVDYQSNNNQSALETFELGKQAVVCNTARPGYSTNRPYDYDKNLKPGTTKNTEFSWAEWKWTQDATTGVGSFTRVKGNDKMNIVIIMTPENESGLRTYTKGLYGIHNYTTRSGYGLSLHRTYEDLTGGWDANKSHIKVGSTVGKMEVVMTFPEFNYTSSYNTAQNANNQKYVYVNADKVGSYYSLILQGYDPTDYTTDDYNDLFAHYTPMWLPDGKYTPVTHISGMWTPLGELCATVQQGEFANNHARMQALGVYTNEIIIKGSLYDDLYNNP